MNQLFTSIRKRHVLRVELSLKADKPNFSVIYYSSSNHPNNIKDYCK